MKILKAFLIINVILLTGCENNDITNELSDGFSIVLNNKVVISHDDFDYYDYSSHLIYFEDSNSFSINFKEVGEFTVFSDGVKIYSGQILPEHISTPIPSTPMPSTPTLRPNTYEYDNYILPINSISVVGYSGELAADPRRDERIVTALKKYNQFHAGLICEIETIQFLSTKVVLELTLRNNDSFDYYYLDPEKMGVSLFHHFMIGLYINELGSSGRDGGYGGYGVNNPTGYIHNIEIESPPYRNFWKKEWLSSIKSNETKSIIINYDNFPEVPAGDYLAIFKFSGLNIQLKKEDINQDNGKIWLGEQHLFKKITID